jgi:hypothetical protein
LWTFSVYVRLVPTVTGSGESPFVIDRSADGVGKGMLHHPVPAAMSSAVAAPVRRGGVPRPESPADGGGTGPASGRLSVVSAFGYEAILTWSNAPPVYRGEDTSSSDLNRKRKLRFPPGVGLLNRTSLETKSG